MAGRGQGRKPQSGGTSRAFYWLNAELSGQARIECTRGVDHYMQKTETHGEGVLKGTVLWVCPSCEPQVDGKWLAQVEFEKAQTGETG